MKEEQKKTPKFDKAEFDKLVEKSFKGPGRIKLKDLKGRKPRKS
jgi:hypothetical protein